VADIFLYFQLILLLSTSAAILKLMQQLDWRVLNKRCGVVVFIKVNLLEQNEIFPKCQAGRGLVLGKESGQCTAKGPNWFSIGYDPPLTFWQEAL
jgi:hypothetical protein